MQKLGEAPKLVRPEHEIDHGVGAFYLLRHVLLLHHAAAHGDYLTRALLLAVIELPDVAQNAHLSVLAHGAGVHDDNVGLELVLCEAVAHLGEIAAYLFAVGLVLLAAVCIHHGKELPPLGGGRYRVAYLGADALLTAYLVNAYFFSLISHFAASF